MTLRLLFERHGIDFAAFDHVAHVGLKEDKLAHFRRIRAGFGINPARSYACGDEFKDYLAAFTGGFHPFVVAYGLESYRRLTESSLFRKSWFRGRRQNSASGCGTRLISRKFRRPDWAICD